MGTDRPLGSSTRDEYMTDHLTRPVHFKNNLADPKGLGSPTFSSWPAPVSILSLLAVETNPSAALHLAALLANRSISAHVSHPSELSTSS